MCKKYWMLLARVLLLEELMLLNLLLFLIMLGMLCNLRVLLLEDADDVGSYFMMDNSLIIFADNIDTKFLFKSTR